MQIYIPENGEDMTLTHWHKWRKVCLQCLELSGAPGPSPISLIPSAREIYTAGKKGSNDEGWLQTNASAKFQVQYLFCLTWTADENFVIIKKPRACFLVIISIYFSFAKLSKYDVGNMLFGEDECALFCFKLPISWKWADLLLTNDLALLGNKYLYCMSASSWMYLLPIFENRILLHFSLLACCCYYCHIKATNVMD